MSVTTPFEPARYLTRISGSDYLEVKWRLVWMRDQHPDATIETQLVSHNDNTAVFRAMVSIPGGGSATGWGSESAGDFRDYLEKAETKAIGRALAALGFWHAVLPGLRVRRRRGSGRRLSGQSGLHEQRACCGFRPPGNCFGGSHRTGSAGDAAATPLSASRCARGRPRRRGARRAGNAGIRCPGRGV